MIRTQREAKEINRRQFYNEYPDFQNTSCPTGKAADSKVWAAADFDT